MQGACPDAPPSSLTNLLRRTAGAAALIPLRPQQCLLASQEDLLPLVGPRVWVDNLYMRVAAPHEPAELRVFNSVGLLSVPRIRDALAYAEPGRALRYITRCTFQGDGLGSAVAIWGQEDAYMERAPPALASLELNFNGLIMVAEGRVWPAQGRFQAVCVKCLDVKHSCATVV